MTAHDRQRSHKPGPTRSGRSQLSTFGWHGARLSVPTKLDQITNPHLAEDSRLESNLGDRWPPICLSYDVGDAFRPHLRGVLAAAAICRPEYLPKDSTLGRKPMDRLEFEAELRRDGYRVVNTSVKPNLVAPNRDDPGSPGSTSCLSLPRLAQSRMHAGAGAGGP